VRTWGAAVLLPYMIVRVVLVQAVWNLKPAIWEAIVLTGWRADGPRQDAVKSRILAPLGMTVTVTVASSEARAFRVTEATK
jgi:hypothetical protein